MEAKQNADTFAATWADVMHKIKVKRKIFRPKKLSFLYVLSNLEHNSRQQNAIKGNFNPNLYVIITYFKPH